MATLMSSVAADGMSVLFSSHVVSELERVCDYLIVLASGHVQVAGEVEELIATHQVLTGPTAQVGAITEHYDVVLEQRADRQSVLLVRGAPDQCPLGWQLAPTNLEELVLSYLRVPGASALSGRTSSARLATA